MELYPYEQWLDYIRINSGVRYNELLETYGADRILLDLEEQAELAGALKTDPLWTLEYEDAFSQIWTRVKAGVSRDWRGGPGCGSPCRLSQTAARVRMTAVGCRHRSRSSPWKPARHRSAPDCVRSSASGFGRRIVEPLLPVALRSRDPEVIEPEVQRVELDAWIHKDGVGRLCGPGQIAAKGDVVEDRARGLLGQQEVGGAIGVSRGDQARFLWGERQESLEPRERDACT